MRVGPLRASISLLACLSTSPLTAAPGEVSLRELLPLRHPHPLELEAEARLAAASRRLAASRGWLLGGATLTAAAGPRRVEGRSAGTDVAVGLDLPLLFARDEQRALAAAIASAAPALRAAARATAELELALAYLEAWRDAEVVALRESQLGEVAAWSHATRRRVEAGADPPWESVAVAGELTRSVLEADRARAALAASHAALAALVPLAAGRSRLAGPTESLAPGGAGGSTVEGARRAAVLRLAELESAETTLEASSDVSRWSVASELAREGDEEVARLGLAYRIAPRGELRSVVAATRAAVAATHRRADAELAALDARVQAARSRVAAAASADPSPLEVDRALAALAARLAEGKDRPSMILPQRRALLDAAVALVESRFERAAALAELRSFEMRVEP